MKVSCERIDAPIKAVIEVTGLGFNARFVRIDRDVGLHARADLMEGQAERHDVPLRWKCTIYRNTPELSVFPAEPLWVSTEDWATYSVKSNTDWEIV